MVLFPRSGIGERLTATIVPGLPVRLALDSNRYFTSTSLDLLLEHFEIVAVTDEERAALATAGVSRRQRR